ncbi:hypothetical protein [Pseudoalteromonas phage PH357]|nr:hypothetical protein [Pseudoalteromonas phage PH357]
MTTSNITITAKIERKTAKAILLKVANSVVWVPLKAVNALSDSCFEIAGWFMKMANTNQVETLEKGINNNTPVTTQTLKVIDLPKFLDSKRHLDYNTIVLTLKGTKHNDNFYQPTVIGGIETKFDSDLGCEVITLYVNTQYGGGWVAYKESDNIEVSRLTLIDTIECLDRFGNEIEEQIVEGSWNF